MIVAEGGGMARLLPQLACWRGWASWHGRTWPRRTASSAMGRRERRRVQRHCLAAFVVEHRLLGQEAAAVVIPGSAAPRIRARHYRTKIGGATVPCHVSGQR